MKRLILLVLATAVFFSVDAAEEKEELGQY